MQSPSPKQPNASDNDGSAPKPATLPEFGKASPLRNPLKKSEPSLFIPRPKPVQKPSPSNPLYASQQRSLGVFSQNTSSSRLDGRSQPAPASQNFSALEAAQAFFDQSYKHSSNASAVEISKPTNAPRPAIPAPPPPNFTSLGSNTYYQPYAAPKPKPTIDLTKSDDDDEDNYFDPDEAIRAERRKFGEPDPYMYVDSTQANENIKNLLEGAFDDEEDKSKTRLRRRAKRALKEGDKNEAKNLANRLATLSMKQEEKSNDTKRELCGEVEEEDEEDDGTVEGLKVKLLPHQVEGVAWMIDKEVGVRKGRQVLPYGGILADDMGLGKTVQSITLILTNPRPELNAKPEHKKQRLPGKEVSHCTLVVAPLALIKQWEDEIKTKVAKSHSLRVLVHHGTSRTKSGAEMKKYDVVITTYQTLTSEHASSNMKVAHGSRVGCFGVHWYRIILDEAHSIKNRNAKASIAACALDGWYRWCLTGTPMQNNLDELQSLIHFLRIKPYHELSEWKEAIIKPMKNGRGGLAMKRLQLFLKAIMKRRTKDILKKEGALNFGGKPSTDAADSEVDEDGVSKKRPAQGMKIVNREVLTVVCAFDGEELQFYLRLQDRADRRIAEIEKKEKADYMGALVVLLRLRQACNHPQLIEMAMNKDRDAMTTGVGNQKAGNVADGDMDALAALMGGVSVQNKHCDVCQIELSRAELQDGCVRCRECEEDLAKVKKSRQKTEKGAGETLRVQNEKRRPRNRRVVDDSDDDDDDEGEGEWIAKGPEQRIDLGQAGGSDDEDAEGGGETLDSIDSERSNEGDDDDDDENSPTRARGTRYRIVNSDTSGEGEDSKADDEEEGEDGSDSEASILQGFQPGSQPHSKPSTKIRHLLRILHAEIPKHKTIVFSQFTSMLDLIEPHLKSSNLRFARYDGSMRPDAREASLHALRTDSKCRILLCSLKCGSLGLNLTAASRVVIIEPFWNPFVEEQAIDRVHRLNQTVDVKVYRLTVPNTVEGKILDLQERKRELAAMTIEGGNKAGVNKLSMQDILSLFKRDAEHSTQHQSAEDWQFMEKFGSDHRLLDGPSGGLNSMSDMMEKDRALGMQKPAKAARKEHDVYGRRW